MPMKNSVVAITAMTIVVKGFRIGVDLNGGDWQETRHDVVSLTALDRSSRVSMDMSISGPMGLAGSRHTF